MKRKFAKPSSEFHHNGMSAKFNKKSRTALDFWKWAYSDLIQNTTRGMIGQYVVAWVLGVDDTPDNTWGSFDLVAPNGKKVEVKTTANVQAWKQQRKPNPQFEIKKTLSYSFQGGFGDKREYQADVYVLGYFFEEKKEKADVMNLNQWKFWILSKNDIKKIFDRRKKISVKKLEELGYFPVSIEKLEDEILKT